MSPYITTKHKYGELARANSPQAESRVLVSLNVAVIAAAVVAVVAYLILFNMLVSRGYMLKNLDQRLTELQDLQARTKRNISHLRSPENLSQAVSALGLVGAGQIAYPKPALPLAKSE